MVEKGTRVVVYGSSLHMAGIVSGLREEVGLDVAFLRPGRPEARERLKQFQPQVIIFDLCDPASTLEITLLRERPDLLLIGADPSSDELLVLSNEPARALSMLDLIGVINKRSLKSRSE